LQFTGRRIHEVIKIFPGHFVIAVLVGDIGQAAAFTTEEGRRIRLVLFEQGFALPQSQKDCER
jgi:hypothetical protein